MRPRFSILFSRHLERMWQRRNNRGTRHDPHLDLHFCADTFLREGRLDEALELYRKAAWKSPCDMTSQKKIGLVLGMMGRYMEAIAAFDEALKIDPRDGQLWMHRGFNFWRLELWQDAQTCFERAIVIDPTDEYARYCQKVTKFAL